MLRHNVLIPHAGKSRRTFLQAACSALLAALESPNATAQSLPPSTSPALGLTPTSFSRKQNGATIHYRQWGSGNKPTMLLLHPAPLNSHAWDSVSPLLAPHFRLIAPDARGFGDSSWSESYADDIYLKDLHTLIQDLNLGKVILCGNSMGGTLSFMYAAMHPEAVDRLILVDTGPGDKPAQDSGNPQPPPARRGPPPMPPGPFASPEEAAAQIPRPFGPAFAKEMVAHNLLRDSSGVWRWKYDLKGTTIEAERSMRDPRKWPLWQAVKCPTLVLRGEKSPAMSQQSADAMIAENRNATLAVIPGAGHFIPIEAPTEFATTVLKWLAV